MLDGGDCPELLRRAVGLVRDGTAAEERATEERRGRLVGVGVASYVEATGIGPFEGTVERSHAGHAQPPGPEGAQ